MSSPDECVLGVVDVVLTRGPAADLDGDALVKNVQALLFESAEPAGHHRRFADARARVEQWRGNVAGFCGVERLVHRPGDEDGAGDCANEDGVGVRASV